MDTQQTIATAATRLQSVGERLSAFLAGSEEVFLRTGARLQGLEQQARRLIEQANHAAQAGTREGEGNPGSTLEREIALLEQHLAHSQSTSSLGIEVMGSVLARVKKLLLFADSFRAIVLTLRALASCTQIENARVGLRGGGFDTVVADVRKMTALITPKYDAVLVQATQVKTTVDRALTNAKGFLDRQGQESSRLRGEAGRSLEALMALATSAERMAGKASRNSGEVAQAIDGVLLSLQVHDLSRQIIEHVAEGLADFQTDALRAVDDNSTTLDGPAWMAELSDVCQLETAQLGAARDKLVGGLRQIDRNLRGMSRLAEELARESSLLAGDKRGGSLLDRVEQSIGKAVKSLRSYLAHERQLMESLKLVGTAVSSMEALVAEVGRVGADAKIVGLNAMVKSCNAGREGHTLTVLAKAIQEISDEIASNSKAVMGLMIEIRTATGRLFGEDGGNLAASGEQGEAIARNLEHTLGALRSYQAELSTGVEFLGSGSAALRSEVGGIAAELGAMVERTESLHAVEDELRAIQQTANGLAGNPPPSRRPVRRCSAAQRYTMESEREVHRNALTSATPGPIHDSGEPADRHMAPGEIELF